MESAKDMHPREDDRNCAESVVGKAEDAQRQSGEIDESPAPDPEEGEATAEDVPEAD